MSPAEMTQDAQSVGIKADGSSRVGGVGGCGFVDVDGKVGFGVGVGGGCCVIGVVGSSWMVVDLIET